MWMEKSFRNSLNSAIEIFRAQNCSNYVIEIESVQKGLVLLSLRNKILYTSTPRSKTRFSSGAVLPLLGESHVIFICREEMTCHVVSLISSCKVICSLCVFSLMFYVLSSMNEDQSQTSHYVCVLSTYSTLCVLPLTAVQTQTWGQLQKQTPKSWSETNKHCTQWKDSISNCFQLRRMNINKSMLKFF